MGDNNQVKIGISFSPYGKTYGRYGNEKFSTIKRHGYDAVDYEIADTNIELYHLNEEDLKRKINAEKASAQATGIKISQVHGPWRYPPQDTSNEEREERLEKMKKAVVISAMLECNFLVIHPIMPFGTCDLESQNANETWDLNLAFFKKLVAFAKEHGITICLENMPMHNFSLSKPEKILALVKEINDDNFKICLDTGHVAVFPELSVGDEIRRLGDYIRVLHIHDNMGDKDSHLYPTKGIIDWDYFVNALDEIGYEGVLSLEASPSGNLEDDVFEKESIDLCKMFKELILANQKKDI